MISSRHAELIAALTEISELAGDIRFGQLLDVVGYLAHDQTDHPLAEIEDHELLAVLEAHRKALARRQSPVAERHA